MNPTDRRPIKTRSSRWAKALTHALVETGIPPNMISVASLFFAMAGAVLVWSPTPTRLFLCAIAIQGRLLCNLLDGMVAIEGGKSSTLGVLYNEVPDRLADAVLIIALGYGIDAPILGWCGALFAILTAYVRLLGGALGLRQNFQGPMAKPHRMAVMTVACLLGAIEQTYSGTQHALFIAAWMILLGCVFTSVRRLYTLAAQLR